MTRSTFYAVGGALALGPAIFLALVLFVLEPPPPTDTFAWFPFTALALAGSSFAMSLVLGLAFPFPATPQGYFTKTVLTMSLNEGAAFFSGVALWQGPRAGGAVALTYAAIVLAYLGLALHFPRPDRVEAVSSPPPAG